MRAKSAASSIVLCFSTLLRAASAQENVGLAIGLIVGVAGGTALLIALLLTGVGVGCYFWRRRRARERALERQPSLRSDVTHHTAAQTAVGSTTAAPDTQLWRFGLRVAPPDGHREVNGGSDARAHAPGDQRRAAAAQRAAHAAKLAPPPYNDLYPSTSAPAAELTQAHVQNQLEAAARKDGGPVGGAGRRGLNSSPGHRAKEERHRRHHSHHRNEHSQHRRHRALSAPEGAAIEAAASSSGDQVQVASGAEARRSTSDGAPSAPQLQLQEALKDTVSHPQVQSSATRIDQRPEVLRREHQSGPTSQQLVRTNMHPTSDPLTTAELAPHVLTVNETQVTQPPAPQSHHRQMLAEPALQKQRREPQSGQRAIQPIADAGSGYGREQSPYMNNQPPLCQAQNQNNCKGRETHLTITHKF